MNKNFRIFVDYVRILSIQEELVKEQIIET